MSVAVLAETRIKLVPCGSILGVTMSEETKRQTRLLHVYRDSKPYYTCIHGYHATLLFGDMQCAQCIKPRMTC